MIVLIDNYDSFTFNLYHLLGELGASVEVYRNDQISVDGVLELHPAAIVLSPGPCTPNEAGICLKLIEAVAERKLPLLGVCLGHQAIGQVFGGEVVQAPVLMHGKVSEIFHGGEGLFSGIPSPFLATRYHSLTLKPETCPEVLKIEAKTEDGVIMALQHRFLPLYGVQFHPESIASEYGHALLKNFLQKADVEVSSRLF